MVMAVKSTYSSLLDRFVSKNLWSLIVLTGSLIIFYTTINLKVSALEQKTTDNYTKINQLEDLVQRVIVLEEQKKYEDQTIKEIKQDTKEIKELVNQHIQMTN